LLFLHNTEGENMGLNIPKGLKRLRADNYTTQKALFEIVDILSNARESPKGNYQQYTLQLIGDISGNDCEIAYLFNRDLNDLIKEWGQATDNWKGKMIEVSAHQDGNYYRWDLKPVDVVK
jgi:hypothetical protein